MGCEDRQKALFCTVGQQVGSLGRLDKVDVQTSRKTGSHKGHTRDSKTHFTQTTQQTPALLFSILRHVFIITNLDWVNSA